MLSVCKSQTLPSIEAFSIFTIEDVQFADSLGIQTIKFQMVNYSCTNVHSWGGVESQHPPMYRTANYLNTTFDPIWTLQFEHNNLSTTLGPSCRFITNSKSKLHIWNGSGSQWRESSEIGEVRERIHDEIAAQVSERTRHISEQAHIRQVLIRWAVSMRNAWNSVVQARWTHKFQA